MPVPLLIAENSPESLLDAQPPGGLVAIAYSLERYWESSGLKDSLVAVFERRHSEIAFIVQADSAVLRDTLSRHEGGLVELAESLNCEIFSTEQTIALNPVHIPKPWGEEIWYTGMEDRGVAGAGHSARSVPLPWVLSALPRGLCGARERSIVLLKILAPRAEEVFGDLYFELHEEKREVYVVTSVDERAWPDGEGAIRFGFCPDKRRQYPDAAAFREAFRQAVADYEGVRREIDARLDERAEREGGDSEREQWLQDLPSTLLERERKLREQMNAFTALKPLKVGDVVKVPTLTPHSLQHGVRTVEFQTPVYERLIVAFAQKVLTQQHWDTDRAVELMDLEPAPQQAFECLRDAGGILEERIVDFADFEVRRLTVTPGGAVELDSPADYAVLMVVQGSLPLGECSLGPEQAVLLPSGWQSGVLRNDGNAPLIFLLAYPR